MKVFLSLLSAFTFFSMTAVAQTAVEGDATVKTVNIEDSNVNWVGSKVTGKHEGEINLKSGELLFADEKLVGGSFTIDMATMVVTDLEGGGATKLEGHLKSDDFFGVESFPTATLEITNVASKGTPGDYKITADLTIKGITNPVKFYASVSDNASTAEIVVDRTEYNVRYGSGSFFDNLGDKTIYDEFQLSVNLSH